MANKQNMLQATSPMPVWLDESHLDCNWLTSVSTEIQNTDVQSCTAIDISNQGRLGSVPCEGATILLKFDNNDSIKQEDIVIKQIANTRANLSKQLGLAREALFYKHLAPQLTSTVVADNSNSSIIIPKIYYAYGNMQSGEKCILMEALHNDEWIDSGVFFGPGNPNNWKRNLPELVKTAYKGENVPPSVMNITKTTFIAIAQMHALFWKDKSLLQSDKQWLRGQNWLQGHGKESWEASQNLIRSIYEQYIRTDNNTIKWNPIVHNAINVAVSGISWQSQMNRLHNDGNWTLVHGDFWPGNVMWNVNNNNNGTIRLLDWEMVGLGSGPQDLGQYILSNMEPSIRRTCERELIEIYYNELIKHGVPNTDNNNLWEYCWKEYTVGGVERWLWFLIYFIGQPNMIDWAQFFHDQISSFMEDHNITPQDITQPRP